MTTFFGLYPATVHNNQDSSGQGRLEVILNTIPGETGPRWAMPCVPYAADNVGLCLLPENGDRVWVAFEEGILTQPVWMGSFWEPSHQLQVGPEVKFLRTLYGLVAIDDVNQKLTIETSDGAKLEMENGAVTLTSSDGGHVTLGNGTAIIEAPGGQKIDMSGSAVVIEGPGTKPARINMENGVMVMEGWPLNFTPPTDAVLARLTALEAEVAALKEQVEGGEP